MKTKTAVLGLFLILGIFIAGCTTAVDNVPENNDTDTITNADTQITGSGQDTLIGTYTLDTQNSKMMWSASKIASNYHTGLVSLKSGSLGLTGDASSGEFVIDMTSITSDENNDALLKHMKSPDFFDVEMYPESRVTLKSVNKIEGNNYEVRADLTILNVTNEIIFIATMMEENNILLAEAEFVIDRTRWGIKYGSGSFFKEMGDKAIKDEVAFTLDLRFNRSE
ncbi:MAG: YceI family protein [Candidatus Nanoarchaeia archaeon]